MPIGVAFLWNGDMKISCIFFCAIINYKLITILYENNFIYLGIKYGNFSKFKNVKYKLSFLISQYDSYTSFSLENHVPLAIIKEQKSVKTIEVKILESIH